MNKNNRNKTSWHSYNEIVDIYDKIMVPYLVKRPAQDLFEALDLARGAKVLDVGTGTGVGAVIAHRAVGAEGAIIGVDISRGMLQNASNKGISSLICGIAPGLPCRNEAFDCVMTIFVLSHIHQYRAALSDMARVLRSGGKIGVSTWGNMANEVDQVWLNIAEKFVPREHIDQAVLQALPSEESLANPDNIKAALKDIGLEQIAIKYNEYEVVMTVSDYLQFKNNGISGRYLNSVLPTKLLEEFKEKVRDELNHIFGTRVDLKFGAYITVAVKPAVLKR
jgi:ubiquinone/menaquinone biosynthesis C-methylase UbiE